MEQKQKNVLYIVLAVGLIGIAVYRLTRPAEGEMPGQISVDGPCLACGKEVAITPALSEPSPWMCPACGERAVYTWLYCPTCQNRFIPALERRGDDPPRMPMMPRCPACGSATVGAFIPDNPDQPLVNPDQPLPRLP